MSTAAAASLPATHRALVLTTLDGVPKVQSVPTPTADAGSAVVRVLLANVLSYSRDLYSGKRGMPITTPLVPGAGGIGRVVSVGADATTLEPGMLVRIETAIHARDEPNNVMLAGITAGFTPGSARLMDKEWRNANYAEYVKMPLENCQILDEKRLTGPTSAGGLGYALDNLAFLTTVMVPFGGLRSIGLAAGETVIVSPATGGFGGAAVLVALAMGATVIAMGRNAAALKAIAARSNRIRTVTTTGDVATDTQALAAHGLADAYFDMSPPAAASSTHFRSALQALRPGGRACFMGGVQGDVALPYPLIMGMGLTIRGNFMYTRDDARVLLQMVEAGVLDLSDAAGVKTSGTFALEEWDQAFTVATKNAGLGQQTFLKP